MKRVTGIGGIFFKLENPRPALSKTSSINGTKLTWEFADLPTAQAQPSSGAKSVILGRMHTTRTTPRTWA
ncbi:MAG TPA: hypothetical protein VK513_00675 [Terriglobales bacterium]|nr:hypothetical protein [Terriglobales bacterium]